MPGSDASTAAWKPRSPGSELGREAIAGEFQRMPRDREAGTGPGAEAVADGWCDGRETSVRQA